MPMLVECIGRERPSEKIRIRTNGYAADLIHRCYAFFFTRMPHCVQRTRFVHATKRAEARLKTGELSMLGEVERVVRARWHLQKSNGFKPCATLLQRMV
jgi:hypothetical protein